MKSYWINLDYRTDRRFEMEQELHKHSICSERFSAFRLDPPDSCKRRLTNPGFYSCSQSHLAILTTARKLCFPSVWIMEDDVAFHQRTSNVLPALFHRLQNFSWDIVYLYQLERAKGCAEDSNLLIDGFHINRIRNNIQSHSYIVNGAFYDTLIDALRMETSQPNDIVMKRMQEDRLCYSIAPSLCTQRISRSDIGNRVSKGLKYL
jgi:GR25 family glycosyltransferase involved in LPS biosynthesis